MRRRRREEGGESQDDEQVLPEEEEERMCEAPVLIDCRAAAVPGHPLSRSVHPIPPSLIPASSVLYSSHHPRFYSTSSI